VPEDAVDVGAGLDELRGEPERLRRRVRVLEAAGVGDEPDVQRLRDRRCERHLERTEDVAHDLRRRGGIVDDQVDVPEARVVVVMVDVENEFGPLDRIQLGTDAALVRAIDREQHSLADICGQLAHEALELEKPVFTRRRRGAGEEHRGVLPESAQRERDAEHRPERVAVRVLIVSQRGTARSTESRDRIASATACTSFIVCAWPTFGEICGCGKICGKLVDQLRHPDASLDRVIVSECQPRSPAQAQLASNPTLEHAVRRSQARHRRLALLLAAEHGDEDDRVAEVRRDTDTRDRHHPDPGILEACHAFGDDDADGFVDAAHALGHEREGSATAS